MVFFCFMILVHIHFVKCTHDSERKHEDSILFPGDINTFERDMAVYPPIDVGGPTDTDAPMQEDD